jgi:hypothetical protein
MRNHPRPVNASDAPALATWRDEAQTLLRELHGACVDANAGQRIYSRQELKRRMARCIKRLGAMVDGLHLPGQLPVGEMAGHHASREAPPEGVISPDAA